MKLAAILASSLLLNVTAFAQTGAQAWERTKQDLTAKGEPIYFEELIPPAIPDEQNFFATPLWQALAAKDDRFTALTQIGNLRDLPERRRPFTKDEKPTELAAIARSWQDRSGLPNKSGTKPAEVVLAVLAPAQPITDELAAAANRPAARYPITYEKFFEAEGPHWVKIIDLMALLQLRAQAFMAMGDSARATQDILLILRLSEALSTEPLIISLLTRQHCVWAAGAAFLDCTREGAWTAGDLEKLHGGFERALLTDAITTGLRGERGNFNQWVRSEPATESRKTFASRAKDFGLDEAQAELMAAYDIDQLRGDQAFFSQSVQNVIDALKARDINRIVRVDSSAGATTKPPLYASLLLAPLRGQASRAINIENQPQLALIAVALERYRLDYRAYPTSIAGLVPNYLREVPQDLVAKRTVEYRPQPGQGYTLACSAMPKVANAWRPPGGQWEWERKP
jgi:hypothetical protein